VELLKRDLSRCHDVLGNSGSERDFLSIITLIESALSQMKWKQYTIQQVDTIRQALDIGYRQVAVSYEDYQLVRKLLAVKDIDPVPRIDLDALKLEDLEDDETD
jgi:hypothetical protein